MKLILLLINIIIINVMNCTQYLNLILKYKSFKLSLIRLNTAESLTLYELFYFKSFFLIFFFIYNGSLFTYNYIITL